MGTRLQPLIRALFWTLMAILALALCALTGLACLVGCVLK